jgi:aromatic ring-opening dioxygenase catalytic subunit (LigB family)
VPALARRVSGRLAGAGVESSADTARGWDHGVFAPLKVMFPPAEV